MVLRYLKGKTCPGNRESELKSLINEAWIGSKRMGLQKFLAAGVPTSFPIPVPHESVAYCPMPKNASTSLKQMIARRAIDWLLSPKSREAIDWADAWLSPGQTFERFTDDSGKVDFISWAQYTSSKKIQNLPSHEILPTVFRSVPLFVPRVYVVRDPLERFVSCFRNRIVRQFDTNLAGKEFRDWENQDVDLLVDGLQRWAIRIAGGSKLSPDEIHHFAPQAMLMENPGAGPEHLFDISDLRAAAKMLGFDEEPHRSQEGGPRLSVDMLSRQSVRLLKEAYKDDYRRIGLY